MEEAKSTTTLFMLTILPPEPLTSELEEVRQEFASHFQCRAALKPPVHITLVPPFKATMLSIEAASEAARAVLSTAKPFTIVFEGFGSFPKNRVIYVHVNTDRNLLELQGILEQLMQRYFGNEIKKYPAYHPHYTIGRKDIPKHRYSEAERLYRERAFTASFLCTEVAILRHNGSKWEPFEMVPLGE